MDQQNEKLRSDIRAQMENKGSAQVRTLMQAGIWPAQHMHIALEWLKEKDQEAERLTTASNAEMAATASRAASAAERAVAAAEEQARTAKHALITAVVATAIAAIALMVSIMGAVHFLG
jgi:hypothetical protein